MAQVEFLYKGTTTTIECQVDQKIADIFNTFISKANINENEINYYYNDKIVSQNDKNRTFNEFANSLDKSNKKMKIIVKDDVIYDDNTNKDKNIIFPGGEIKLKIKIEKDDVGKNIYFLDNTHGEVYVVQDNEIIAIIGVNEVVRENVNEVIEKLKLKGISTVMLTGDNDKTAKRIADKIGITQVYSNVLPKEKKDIIQKFKDQGQYVLMCGDGINDSPALTLADVGVSINSGSDIAMDSSDVILTRNDLNSIINLINISKKTIRNIKQNLFWAFLYNILMIPIATGLFKRVGFSINPMIASLAMVISSLTVVLNTLRLKKIKLQNI